MRHGESPRPLPNARSSVLPPLVPWPLHTRGAFSCLQAPASTTVAAIARNVDHTLAARENGNVIEKRSNGEAVPNQQTTGLIANEEPAEKPLTHLFSGQNALEFFFLQNATHSITSPPRLNANDSLVRVCDVETQQLGQQESVRNSRHSQTTHDCTGVGQYLLQLHQSLSSSITNTAGRTCISRIPRSP